MPSAFMLDENSLAYWTWYQPDYPARGNWSMRPRLQTIRDGEPRLPGELILAGILEGA